MNLLYWFIGRRAWVGGEYLYDAAQRCTWISGAAFGLQPVFNILREVGSSSDADCVAA